MPCTSKLALALVASLSLGGHAHLLASRVADVEAVEANANPIRKVVTLMEKLAKKIEQEGEEEAQLYKKFECYCKTTKASLDKSIAIATGTGGISPEAIQAKKAELVQKKEEVVKLKKENVEEQESLKAGEENRLKEHSEHQEVVAEGNSTKAAVENALKAIGVNPKAKSSLLSTLFQVFEHSKSLAPDVKARAAAFLQSHRSQTAEIPAEVKVVLEDVKEDAEESIAQHQSQDQKQAEQFTQVKQAKERSLASILTMLENKMQQIGSLEVEIVNMEHDLKDSKRNLIENQKMLSEVTTDCETKSKEWAERQKVRADEQTALSETIRMLNDDEALDLFKKTLPSPSLIQLRTIKEQQLQKASALVQAVQALALPDQKPALNFLALALTGTKGNFSKIFEKIDEMVNLMKKEQVDDETKNNYCNQEFTIAEGKSKDLNIKVEQFAATIHNTEDAVDKLKDEIAAIQDGMKSLDASLAEAATNRKAEHSEYEELISSNSEAVRLLGAAKERLNKFYNPSLTTDTTTTSNPYALSLVQINLHRNDTNVQGPPPTFSGSYKAKGEESNGVLGMLTTLSHDLQQEMTIAKVQEQTSQKEYEQTLADAKEKREADISSINSKAKAKADFETDLNEAKGEKKSREDEVETLKKYVSDLHGQCDWLIKNFELRKQARTEEQESLTNAKAVLAGADFS